MRNGTSGRRSNRVGKDGDGEARDANPSSVPPWRHRWRRNQNRNRQEGLGITMQEANGGWTGLQKWIGREKQDEAASN